MFVLVVTADRINQIFLNLKRAVQRFLFPMDQYSISLLSHLRGMEGLHLGNSESHLCYYMCRKKQSRSKRKKKSAFFFKENRKCGTKHDFE